MGYCLNRLDEPVFIAVSKSLLTEFGIHLRLESYGVLVVLEATCSADKARKLLSYKTKTTLDKGLSQMIKYIKDRGTKKFRYHLDLEIVNSLTPKTWKDKLF